MSYESFFDALFFVVDEGSKYRNAKFFGIPKSTFTRHLKFLADHNVLEIVYNELIEHLFLPSNNLLVTDTFAVPSKDGNEGLGYCYKYKGKKCCKVSLIADTEGIVRVATLEPGNVHDAQILRNSLDSFQPSQMVKCLADSGYVGAQLYNDCLDRSIELIAQPRKTKAGRLTHELTPENEKLLKKHRSCIEHLNSKIRKFRGLTVKHVKKIATFKSFLYVALISITCYNLFMSS